MGRQDVDPYRAVNRAPLVLCDPNPAPFWPLSATRPVAALLAGARRFADRWDRPEALLCDLTVAATLSDPVNQWPQPEAGISIALANWIPPAGWVIGDEPIEYRAAGRPVAWRLDAERAASLVRHPPEPAGLIERLVELALPTVSAGGSLIASLPELIDRNPEIVVADAASFDTADAVRGVDPLALLGDDLRVGAGVTIGPFVTIDTERGPVLLDDAVRVEPGSVLRGPLYAGPETHILGGEIGSGTSLGPRCKVRGEIAQSVFQGFVNKAHEGFVGHSALGSWVNLGAGTTTSDLKNTYGSIRLRGPDETIETGLLKLGAMLGDHVKTGIGALLTTGARFGVGTHFFGGTAVSPPYLPHFAWFDGTRMERVELERFLETAAIAMGRRDAALSAAESALLTALHATEAAC